MSETPHVVVIETPQAFEPQNDYLESATPSNTQASALIQASQIAATAPPPYPQHGYKRHRRECHAIRIYDAAQAMLCPCISAAQIASALGKSYKWTLLLYGMLYLVSGISFLVAFWNALEFCAVWQFKWCGGGVFIETFFVIFVKLDLDLDTSSSSRSVSGDTEVHRRERFSQRYSVHDGTLYVCLVVEWLLVAYIWYLRFQWSHHLQREERGCTDCCAAAYCGCCVLAEVASDVKRQSTTSIACIGAVDTIPPFGSDEVSTDVQYKLPFGCEKWPI